MITQTEIEALHTNNFKVNQTTVNNQFIDYDVETKGIIYLFSLDSNTGSLLIMSGHVLLYYGKPNSVEDLKRIVSNL